MARQLAIALAWQVKANWHTELNAQFYREAEIVSLLLRATAWEPDPELLFLLPSWEAAWLPRPPAGVADAGIDDRYRSTRPRPAFRDTAGGVAAGGSARAGFVCALFTKNRVRKRSRGQILFLKSSELLPLRDAVNAAVESRHLQVRRLWDEMLTGIGVERREAQGTASPAAAATTRRGP
jgi:hypothetical protein